MNKTIGILAHVDAGKTTFSEQFLFHTNSIKQRGRVDHRDAFLDNHSIEKQRGITVFADQGMIECGNSTYFLIDNPGHVDFSPEMERSIQVLDYAIVIISGVEGVEGHTETVWQLLRKYNIPTFFFINKIDRVGADVERVTQEIRTELGAEVFDISKMSSQGDMSENLIEYLAEQDDTLFEQYMETGYQKDMWKSTMIRLIRESEIFPCANGSALQDIGIVDFIEKLDELTVTDYPAEAPFSGKVYKIRHDENGTRITFIKALTGVLKIRDELSYGSEDNRLTEKITQIRYYNGSKFQTVNEVSAGQLFAVVGLSQAAVGDGVGTLMDKSSYEIMPTLKSKVMIDSSVHVKDALRCFNLLDAEDPSLHIEWEDSLQEIHIHVMGAIQLEVLKELVKERFHFDVSFAEPEIIYKETVNSIVTGYGHFEPLGHYAEVHLQIEPTQRNSGIVFENK